MSGPVMDCPEQPLRLTVLVENTAPDTGGLTAEHGLAVLVETDRGRVLFDTGASGEALSANAAAMGASLAGLSAIVLSHGHYDHTGGLATALAASPTARVHFHWRCTAERWAQRWGLTKSIGMPAAACRALGAADRRPVSGPVVLSEGVVLSGPIPGPPAPAQRGFVIDSDGGRSPDPFEDELFLLARSPSGWVLLTGCCHRGLPNTLAYARRLAGGGAVASVVGGLHLGGLSRSVWEEGAGALAEAGVRRILAGHCTGRRAGAWLADRLGEGFGGLCAGRVVEW